MEWISVKDKMPESFEEVYIKTECENCPILTGTYWQDAMFVLPVLMECEDHCTSEHAFLGPTTQNKLAEYNKRITHWSKRNRCMETVNGRNMKKGVLFDG